MERHAIKILAMYCYKILALEIRTDIGAKLFIYGQPHTIFIEQKKFHRLHLVSH